MAKVTMQVCAPHPAEASGAGELTATVDLQFPVAVGVGVAFSPQRAAHFRAGTVQARAVGPQVFAPSFGT